MTVSVSELGFPPEADLIKKKIICFLISYKSLYLMSDLEKSTGLEILLIVIYLCDMSIYCFFIFIFLVKNDKDEEQRQRLNRITHPEIYKEMTWEVSRSRDGERGANGGAFDLRVHIVRIVTCS